MTRKAAFVLLSVLAASALPSCGKDRADIAAPSVQDYSFARPKEVAVLHMDLDIDVNFERRVIAGSVAFDIENRANANAVHFDTWALRIREVSTEDDQGRVAEANWVLGDSLEMIGRPLSVAIVPATRRVLITYETTPGQDRGVQWLTPAQTAGKQHPYMFTQSQAIHARSWVPCQDTPADRFTFTARVRVPVGLMALMGAANPRERSTDGAYRFEMKEPLPSYLLALAVGDIDYRAIGERTGVYSEPSMVEKAAWEFADLEKMMKTAEKMNGPYRWGQYDLLVLPPAFPFGGMENPRLSFLSPVLLAGDRSLVSTVAHELAHSWSGNLVTNETWNDIWLNEGFTTYFERRIVEQIYGREYRDMQAMLGLRDIELEFEEIGADSKDTALYVEYAGRNPDEVPTAAAYEKACLFLTMMEDSLGSAAWDNFLRGYFEAHAFKTMTTKRFVEYMKGTLFAADSTRYQSLRVEEWIYEPGIPANAPKVESKRFEEVDRQIDAFARGVAAKNLKTGGWTTMEWQRFLDNLPSPLPAARLADLDETFGFSHANAVVQRSWFPSVIAAKYEPAYPAIETFLLTIGRRYLLRPVYGELAKTPEGLAFARRVFEQARPGYHAITATGIEMVLYPEGRASK